MTTLEALATYGGSPDGPPAGRLTGDVDPPGFEALAALVPRGGASARQGHMPSRVIPFSQPVRDTAPKGKATPEEDARRRDAERRKKQADARKALVDAERALKEAKRAAEQARAAMKTAAARAKEAEKAKAALETRFEKVSAEADAARQEARRVASQAEEAAQAMDDAERAVTTAREMLKKTRDLKVRLYAVLIVARADAHLARPPVRARHLDPELIQHPRHGVIDHLVERARVDVERRHRRQDDRPHPRELEHVLEMDLAERRLANRQQQPAALLQRDVGGAMHEAVAVAVRDRASVFTLHGAMIIPSAWNDPLAIAAPMSLGA